MTDDLYYRKMESTSTIDLVDMVRERDERIIELEKENAEREKRDEKVRELVEQARILLACNFGVIPPKAEINIQEV